MSQITPGKIKARDERIARLLNWTPWLSFVLVTVPLPVFFVLLFLTSVTTDSAAIYLLLSFVSMGVGLVAGLFLLIVLLLYRRRWHGRLRDHLAGDGITADEVVWFTSELTSEERKIWRTQRQERLVSRCLLRNASSTPDCNQDNRQGTGRDIESGEAA